MKTSPGCELVNKLLGLATAADGFILLPQNDMTHSTEPSILRRIARFCVKPRGDRRWDVFLRGTALIALIGIPLVVFFPESTPLVWFAVVAVPVNSPLSPLTPVAFEPLIMEAAKHSPAIHVTIVGLAMFMYTEYLNYYIYKWVLDRQRFAKVREHRLVKRATLHFARAPWVVSFVFALTPLPGWVVRILAIYHGYSVPRYMVATAVGRAPQIFFYAVIGELLNVPAVALGGLAVGATVVVIAIRLAKRERLLHDEVLDADIGASEVQPEPLTPLEPAPVLPAAAGGADA